jgi:3-oxoacyl-[acyl-carrier protein] reductase
MNKYDFSEQIAVITGGCNGIGAAVVKKLIHSGARVCIWDMNIEDCEEEVNAQSRDICLKIQTDVSDFDSVTAALAKTKSIFGNVSVLINSAGIAGPTYSLADYPLDQWRKVQAINLDGTFHCCKVVIPDMLASGYGRIVNIASVAGKEGNPNASAYSASKAGVIALTKSLGKELASADIAVNCITPAAAQTRIFNQISQEFIDYMLSKIPRGRFVTVDEIASMIAWVASKENSFTTGATFDISGGRATF